MVETSWPRAWWRTVPSICRPAMRMAPTSQRLEWPVAHGRALPAGGDEAEDDVVARLQPGDAGAHLLDHAGALVTPDDGQRDGHVTGDEVLVGVAHARRGELDEHLALLRWVELDGLHAPLA